MGESDAFGTLRSHVKSGTFLSSPLTVIVFLTDRHPWLQFVPRADDTNFGKNKTETNTACTLPTPGNVETPVVTFQPIESESTATGDKIDQRE